MKHKAHIGEHPATLVKTLAPLVAIALGAVLAGCQPQGLVYDPHSGQWVSPLPTVTPPTSPLPTAIGDEVDPTLPPSPTAPPVPTLLPTPVVTPIPTAVPPIIPEVVGQIQQPFWIIYWKGNEVWRIDNQGKDRQLLLDTYRSLGQWLTEIPQPYRDSDCCWIGPRVVVSPDGQKLALVLVDRINGTKLDRFTFSIYVLGIQTSDLNLIGEGVLPVWSPDSRRIAFRMERGLWIADVETGQVRERVAAHEDPDMHITEYAWSPDSTQIAYLYNFSMQRLPEAWVANTDDETPPRKLFGLNGYPIYGITWSPDGQRVFFLSPEGGRDTSSYHAVQNLWAVSPPTGTRAQLTQDIEVQSYGILPGGKWMFLVGFHRYERNRDRYDRDLWLLSLDGKDLRRVTADQGDLAIAGWSPDGTRWVVWRAEASPLLFSLVDGTGRTLDLDLGIDYEVGGVK